jgi:Ni,Fe-hydrogenase III large subunit
MAEALRKDTRRKSIVSNARAIHGALAECLKLADQMQDVELKSEAMLFVNAVEHLAASLLPHRRRIGSARPSARELADRLREEVLHVRQLLEAIGYAAHELDDANTRQIVASAMARLQQFAALIDRKNR